jgi:hypothetical protein
MIGSSTARIAVAAILKAIDEERGRDRKPLEADFNHAISHFRGRRVVRLHSISPSTGY